MREFVNRLSAVLAKVSRAAMWVAGTALVIMTASITWQVFGRYILNDTPSWTEPVSLQCMLWFAMLGAGVGVRERFHLSLDIVRGTAPISVRNKTDAVAAIIVGLFGAAMVGYGIEFTAGTWSASKPVLGLPEGIDYIPLCIGGLMVFVFSIEQLLKLYAFPEHDERVNDPDATVTSHSAN